ncbi:hypothetical protein BDD43_3420 [Mucilaginibacter gracilis]|uniref:DUF2786 domain-containing protein n=1 Tax=Mucilaginibacter gracilis TaxID=423350 RepID=A0A495J4A9_9SPHI|nr:hypothetical protein [Mucilaginibacter gracilis]RKR83218.1 hypothetical protein BDD43_3420 [Mucilaginibacter gracilis]
MTPEQKEKLKKIYELVKRGSTEGERAAAEKALDKMLEKYNMKGVDLDSLDMDWYGLSYTTDLELSLMERLIKTMLGDYPKDIGRMQKGSKTIHMRVTYFDYITVSSAYEYFRRHMKLQWQKFAAPHVAKCRTTKTKNARRKQLQDVFFNKYAIASNFYKPEELQPVDWDSLPKKEQQDYIKLHKVEGGTYNVQVTNGLLLEK